MVKIMENPIKIDDLGVPLFLETPIYIYNCLFKKTLILPTQETISQQAELGLFIKITKLEKFNEKSRQGGAKS